MTDAYIGAMDIIANKKTHTHTQPTPKTDEFITEHSGLKCADLVRMYVFIYILKYVQIWNTENT